MWRGIYVKVQVFVLFVNQVFVTEWVVKHFLAKGYLFIFYIEWFFISLFQSTFMFTLHCGNLGCEMNGKSLEFGQQLLITVLTCTVLYMY